MTSLFINSASHAYQDNSPSTWFTGEVEKFHINETTTLDSSNAKNLHIQYNDKDEMVAIRDVSTGKQVGVYQNGHFERKEGFDESKYTLIGDDDNLTLQYREHGDTVQTSLNIGKSAKNNDIHKLLVNQHDTRSSVREQLNLITGDGETFDPTPYKLLAPSSPRDVTTTGLDGTARLTVQFNDQTQTATIIDTASGKQVGVYRHGRFEKGDGFETGKYAITDGTTDPEGRDPDEIVPEFWLTIEETNASAYANKKNGSEVGNVRTAIHILSDRDKQQLTDVEVVETRQTVRSKGYSINDREELNLVSGDGMVHSDAHQEFDETNEVHIQRYDLW